MEQTLDWAAGRTGHRRLRTGRRQLGVAPESFLVNLCDWAGGEGACRRQTWSKVLIIINIIVFIIIFNEYYSSQTKQTWYRGHKQAHTLHLLIEAPGRNRHWPPDHLRREGDDYAGDDDGLEDDEGEEEKDD